MAKTIKNQFSNVYGEGKNLNIGKNKSVKELLNNIPNVELSPNEINNELSNSISNKLNNKLNKTNGPLNPVNVEKSIGFNTVNKSYSPFKIIYLLIIIIIFSIIGVIYYYRDIIMQYLDSITNKKDITSDKIDSTNEKVDHTSAKIDSTNAKVDSTNAKVDSTNAKVDDTSSKIDSTSAKLDGLEDKINKLSEKKDCPAIDTLNTKLDKVSTYSKEQNVSENGFCYIGYDNGQRDCIDVYAGDICMSGEIFPTLDICINPKLRV